MASTRLVSFEQHDGTYSIPRDQITGIHMFEEDWESGKRYTVKIRYGHDNSVYDVFKDKQQAEEIYQKLLKTYKGENNMLKEVKDTVEQFIKDNRMVITWIAVLFLADHFFFNGKFRERLHGMIDNLINRTKSKIKEIQ